MQILGQEKSANVWVTLWQNSHIIAFKKDPIAPQQIRFTRNPCNFITEAAGNRSNIIGALYLIYLSI